MIPACTKHVTILGQVVVITPVARQCCGPFWTGRQAAAAIQVKAIDAVLLRENMVSFYAELILWCDLRAIRNYVVVGDITQRSWRTSQVRL